MGVASVLSSTHMRVRIEYYVAFIVACAVVCVGVVYRVDPAVSEAGRTAIVLMALLAIVAEALGFILPLSSTGSMAFIPYFATMLLAPSWLALVAVGSVRIAADAISRKETIKTAFNSSQHVLILGIAILLFRRLGGTSLLDLDGRSLIQATAAIGGAALGAFTIAYILSGLLVSCAIAIAKGLDWGQVWRTNHFATLWLDLLSLPLIFIFAWVYARFGAIAAVATWVPILGLRQVHKINHELEQTNQELLELMVKSMEARDPYTSGHSRRVHHYSTVIARAVGLSERDVNLASRAALLHDVGKIHEKYGPILSKSDRLSPEEWAIIQSHPADGASLVSTMSRLRELVAPIRNHHENWDGTGYPDGLAGELIPLASRIIRFADTIDAMTTDRPYRSSLSEAQVRSELIRCRGQQFDPAITDKLLSSPQWTQLFATSGSAPSTKPRLSVLPHSRAAG